MSSSSSVQFSYKTDCQCRSVILLNISVPKQAKGDSGKEPKQEIVLKKITRND